MKRWRSMTRKTKRRRLKISPETWKRRTPISPWLNRQSCQQLAQRGYFMGQLVFPITTHGQD
jgi:hypothetical protein